MRVPCERCARNKDNGRLRRGKLADEFREAGEAFAELFGRAADADAEVRLAGGGDARGVEQVAGDDGDVRLVERLLVKPAERRAPFVERRVGGGGGELWERHAAAG